LSLLLLLYRSSSVQHRAVTTFTQEVWKRQTWSCRFPTFAYELILFFYSSSDFLSFLSLLPLLLLLKFSQSTPNLILRPFFSYIINYNTIRNRWAACSRLLCLRRSRHPVLPSKHLPELAGHYTKVHWSWKDLRFRRRPFGFVVFGPPTMELWLGLSVLVRASSKLEAKPNRSACLSVT
jgi:hypothetical protein